MTNEVEQIESALRAITHSMPAGPRVVDLRFDLGVDEAGDPAIFVVVLLDEGTKEKDWVSPRLDPIADRVREALRAAEVRRWPYVRFAKPSDLKTAG